MAGQNRIFKVVGKNKGGWEKIKVAGKMKQLGVCVGNKIKVVGKKIKWLEKIKLDAGVVIR